MFYKSIAPDHRKVFHQGVDKEQIIFHFYEHDL